MSIYVVTYGNETERFVVGVADSPTAVRDIAQTYIDRYNYMGPDAWVEYTPAHHINRVTKADTVRLDM